MKKLINGVDNIVDEMLDGMIAAYPQYLKRLDGFDVVVRAGGSQGKVALVSGGGSGHEPAHGGYVGKGMLDGAIAGAVFFAIGSRMIVGFTSLTSPICWATIKRWPSPQEITGAPNSSPFRRRRVS